MPPRGTKQSRPVKGKRYEDGSVSLPNGKVKDAETGKVRKRIVPAETPPFAGSRKPRPPKAPSGKKPPMKKRIERLGRIYD